MTGKLPTVKVKYSFLTLDLFQDLGYANLAAVVYGQKSEQRQVQRDYIT